MSIYVRESVCVCECVSVCVCVNEYICMYVADMVNIFNNKGEISMELDLNSKGS